MTQFWIFVLRFWIGRTERKKIFRLALGALLFVLCSSAAAQQPKKISRIGFLASGSSVTDAPRIEAFHQGLRDLGYVEGQNIVIEYRYGEGRQSDFLTSLPN